MFGFLAVRLLMFNVISLAAHQLAEEFKFLESFSWSLRCTLTWKLACMVVYVCVCVCFCMPEQGPGKNECPVSWWDVWSGPWPLGQQWDEVQLLFKVYRVVLGVYRGEGYKQRGAKRWVRKMVKCEEGEGLKRQRERGEHTVNRKTSGLIFISRQIPLRLNWYWGL